jgi:transketolase
VRVRDAFFTEVYRRTCEGEDIVIVSSDLGAPSLDDFRRDFPERFINVGIAEQNSIAVAGGLSWAGKKVITYGLNPFPVTRAFDQVRNVLASLQIPVTVTALNAGSCSAEAGYTHMPVENMPIMRTLKNVDILNPSDEAMAVKLVGEVVDNPKPRYVQFDKYIDGRILNEDDIDFDKGYVAEGSGKVASKIALVTYGIYAYELRKKKLPVNVKLIDCFKLPIDEDKFLKELDGVERIYTVEDSIAPGGIGSMVLEILNDRGLYIPVEKKALFNKTGYPEVYMNRSMLWEREGIAVDDIVNELARF